MRKREWIPVRIRQRAAYRNGGLVQAAEAVRKAGRYGDDVLVHVNKRELADMIARWGKPTINPVTKIPEFFLGGDFFKDNPWLLPLATSVIAPSVGSTVGGFLNDNVLGGALGSTGSAALGGALVNGGLGYLTGGGKGALYGAGIGAAMPYIQGGALGSTLQGLTGGGHGYADMSHGGMGPDMPADVAKAGTVGSGGSSGSGGFLSGLGGGSLGSMLPLLALAAAAGGSKGGPNGSGGSSPTAYTAGQQQAIDSNNQHLSQVKYDRPRNSVSNQDVLTAGYRGEPTFFKDNKLPGYADGGEAQPQVQQPPPEIFEIVDGHTGQVVGQTADRRRAMIMRDRRDNAYGGYRYQVRAQGAKRGYADGGAPQGRGALSMASHDRPLYVRGPGSGRADKIPAELSDGEYVFTAEDVSLLGDGSSDHGARVLDQFRENLRRHKGQALAQGKISPDALPPEAYLPRGQH
jgi:hypothetical protein